MGVDPVSKLFRKCICQFNVHFAFTSFQYGHDSRTNNGLRVFQVNGITTYHLQHPLYPPNRPDAQLQFSPTWIYDGAMALEARSHRNPNLNPDLILQLTEMLLQVNPFIQLYRTAYERFRMNQRNNYILTRASI